MATSYKPKFFYPNEPYPPNVDVVIHKDHKAWMDVLTVKLGNLSFHQEVPKELLEDYGVPVYHGGKPKIPAWYAQSVIGKILQDVEKELVHGFVNSGVFESLSFPEKDSDFDFSSMQIHVHPHVPVGSMFVVSQPGTLYPLNKSLFLDPLPKKSYTQEIKVPDGVKPGDVIVISSFGGGGGSGGNGYACGSGGASGQDGKQDGGKWHVVDADLSMTDSVFTKLDEALSVADKVTAELQDAIEKEMKDAFLQPIKFSIGTTESVVAPKPGLVSIVGIDPALVFSVLWRAAKHPPYQHMAHLSIEKARRALKKSHYWKGLYGRKLELNFNHPMHPGFLDITKYDKINGTDGAGLIESLKKELNGGTVLSND